MHAIREAANPFGLLTNPQEVLRAVEASEKLQSLNRQICRPLDKPVGGRAGAEQGAADGATGDAESPDALEAAGAADRTDDHAADEARRGSFLDA
jgi:hypothetical protein